MRRVRRNDLAPRVEMVPLIDVIFLLLTFFIYSMVTMIHANVLPVNLATVQTGKSVGQGRIAAITMDRTGELYWNRKPITRDELTAKLQAIGGMKNPPRLYLAMQAVPRPRNTPPTSATRNDNLPVVDRGPLLMNLVQRIRAAGIKDFSFVGQPHGP